MILVVKTQRGDIAEFPCSELISIEGLPYTPAKPETVEGLSVRLTALELLISQMIEPEQENE